MTTLRKSASGIAKAPTGIVGLDQITSGGLPKGRPTLVCGSAGSGKTLLATEFLVRGATQFGEPGVLVAFEETAQDLRDNVLSLGFRLDQLVAKRQLFIDHVQVERHEIQESGEYNLDGLFIRLAHAIDTIKAKRVVLDTIETLFSSFSNAAILRAELQRLFGWLKDRGVTAVITAERGDGQLTRQGLEEYVSDCVILLDQRVVDTLATRRLRVVKYRGSAHGNNEYPFLIDADGISVLPITSLGLQHQVSNRWVSSGLPALDGMLGGKGVYQGSSLLVSGPAGTGKSTLTAQFALANCHRGARSLIFAHEELPPQIVRNMRSVGLDLQPAIARGLLRIESSRPAAFGLEMHLVRVHKLVEQFQPSLVIVDPLSNLSAMGTHSETLSMLTRLIDFLKSRGTTGLFTSLTAVSGASLEQTDLGISSLIDSWLLVRQIERNGERNRTLSVLKSRGMPHSNQVREFLLSSKGLELREAYIGEQGVLTGSSRLAREVRDREEELTQLEAEARSERTLVARQKAVEAQIAAATAELRSTVEDLASLRKGTIRRTERAQRNREAMAKSCRLRNPLG